MGRYRKKIIGYFVALMVAGLPMSVSLAAVDCLFHDATLPNAQTYEHEHGGFALDISDLHDIGVKHVDSADAPEVMADTGCEASLMVVTDARVELLFSDMRWDSSLVVVEPDADLVDVILPGEIRPPISA